MGTQTTNNMQAITKLTRQACLSSTNRALKTSTHHCAPASWTQDDLQTNFISSANNITQYHVPASYSSESPSTKAHNACATTCATNDTESQTWWTSEFHRPSESASSQTSQNSMSERFGEFLGSIRSAVESHVAMQAADPLDVRETTQTIGCSITIPVGLDGAAAAVSGAITNLPAAAPTTRHSTHTAGSKTSEEY